MIVNTSAVKRVVKQNNLQASKTFLTAIERKFTIELNAIVLKAKVADGVRRLTGFDVESV